MEKSQRVLKLAVSIGETLLENGGEIYRVQETIGRVLTSYGIEDYNVYVISNAIFATIHEDSENHGSMVRYIPLGSIHLGRVAAVNHLSREICCHKYDVEEAFEKLKQCQAMPRVSKQLKCFASGMGCAAFCYIFGGHLFDSLIAFGLGILLQLFLLATLKSGTSKFIINIIGSAMVTLISLLLVSFGLNIMQDKVVIGAIMLLVPGMALTTSIRELFSGDYLSGSIHLIDALLTAFCIAVGVGTAVKLFQMLGGVLL